MMVRFILLVFAFLASSKATTAKILNVAVVEYQSYKNSSVEQENIVINMQNYIKQISDLRDHSSLDLVVFPESTLGDGPDTAVELKEGDVPCDLNETYAKHIVQFSCIARAVSSYLVVNLIEKINCTDGDDSELHNRNCKNLGHRLHNTDVVFDRDGGIDKRYHKYNLFGEFKLDRPSSPELVVVTIDGTKFGIFTCFDILFKSPAQDLGLNKSAVDAVIYPTMWFSELPFLTSLQTQQMWSHAHDAKLFAAGANNPQRGSGGSGAYNGKEGAVYNDIIGAGGSKAYLFSYDPTSGIINYNEEVNLDLKIQNMDQFYLGNDTSVLKYTSKPLDLTKSVTNESLCHNDTNGSLCCNFSIKINVTPITPKSNFYTYHLVAYTGVRSFTGVANGGIEICALVACLNTSLSSCGYRFPPSEEITWNVNFEELSITANFDKDNNRTQYPNSLLSTIRPIDAKKVQWVRDETQKDVAPVSFKIVGESQSEIITFGIYGRNFALDWFPDRDSSVASVTVNGLLMGVVVMLSLFATK